MKMKILSIIALLALPALAQEEEYDRAKNWTFEGEPITEESLQQMREYSLNIAFLDVHDCSEVMASGNQDDISLCLDAQEFLLAINNEFACLLKVAPLTGVSYPPDKKKEMINVCIESLQGRLNDSFQGFWGDRLAERYSAFFNMEEAEQMAEENLNRMRVYRIYLMMKIIRD